MINPLSEKQAVPKMEFIGTYVTSAARPADRRFYRSPGCLSRRQRPQSKQNRPPAPARENDRLFISKLKPG